MSNRRGFTGELAFIDHIRKSFPSRSRMVALGIGDDCAILRPPRASEIVVTTDFTLENRHFRRDLHPPKFVGHRCLARGLSDLAAMGATPLAAFLSLALPGDMFHTGQGQKWMAGFFSGLGDLAREHQTTIAGGDTSESPADLLLADIVLVGHVPIGRSLRRSGAQAGDGIYVTGTLGGAQVQLTDLLSGKKMIPRGSHTSPHFFPQPRLQVGVTLVRRKLAASAIDISDGLSTDLTHLCDSSGVSALIDASAIPIHPLAQNLDRATALNAALHGGEDYELLFTARPGVRVPKIIGDVPITRIGSMGKNDTKKARIIIRGFDGKLTTLKAGGWEHFSS